MVKRTRGSVGFVEALGNALAILMKIFHEKGGCWKGEPMRITANKLREAEACEQDVAKFENQWPSGCNVTKENCLTAFVELGLDPDWAAAVLLSRAAQHEYLAATSTQWREYIVVQKIRRHEFKTACAIAFWRAAI